MTYEEEIDGQRKEINRINAEIVEKIAERVRVAKEVAEIKRRYGKPVVDKQREKAVLDQVRILAAERGIEPDSAEKVFAEIIRICVQAEERP